MRAPRFRFTACLLVLTVVAALAVQAGVLRVEVRSRSDLLNGKAFGTAGPYEKIIGKVWFAVDPKNPHNRVIVDLDKVPRSKDGLVEFSADLFVLKPKDPRRGNGAVLLEIPNRGGKGMLRFFNHAAGSLNPATEEEMGDGFLMRQGFTLVWIGWQYDVPAGEFLMRLSAPRVTQSGKPITGLVRSDFVFPVKTYDATLGHRGQNAQPVLSPNDPEDVLTVRETVLGARRIIPRNEWQFARLINGSVVPDSTFIYLKAGFEPGKIYEVVYRTHNPAVVGLGLAAVRDLVSYFKHQAETVVTATYAYGFGISQSGRFLRHFLYQGFNADEKGRKVFDGIDAHVAGGGRGSFNHRYAEPSRDASPFYTFFFPTDIFPFTDVRQEDPETGETDGVLTHALNTSTLPKIFYTCSSYEYWGRAASLIHTTVDGESDAPMMSNVRIYYFAGGQHGAARFPPSIPVAKGVPLTQQRPSPNDYTWSMRAILLALDRWVREGTLPPQSRYPRIANGTLVRPKEVKFPDIPGVNFPRSLHEAYRVDYGPEWKSRGIIGYEPPHVGKAFPVLVPQVDSDGIDLAGIRMPEVAVPLATYTGWNPRDPRTGAPNQLVDFLGSYIPFARTRAERERTRDPRPSIEERHKNREDYIRQIDKAIADLTKERLLLREDAPALLQRAGEYWDDAMK